MFNPANFKYCLGSAYIISYLRKYDFTAEQFISNSTANAQECARRINNFNPKIVGFTVYDSNFMQCALISNGIKLSNSDIPIIFGGPTATVQSKEILESVKKLIHESKEDIAFSIFFRTFPSCLPHRARNF